GRLRAGGAPDPAGWTAWIGPALGPCCYEVGEEVAEAVAAASDPAVVSRPAAGARPRLDLAAAARRQLAALGVEDVRTVAACTRCEADLLWSYRRDGRRAGRNHAFIWKRAG
ncbi:MAG TPA: laccase domain-containing protein, partial [Thermoanaerobaculia bacterium]|nr:laccase domain-containing protein [Thermoanaerobaculia bacterium]